MLKPDWLVKSIPPTLNCLQILCCVHYVESHFNDELKYNERSACGARQGASREKLSKANSKRIVYAYNTCTQLHTSHSGGFRHALLNLNYFCWCVAACLIKL